ncbi:MAG TPA: helix-turn-helix domain-containing protein [Patescibacteria group bacterium]|nr:helix-turn-helix domain-containing protein [Patescibacteria group bacterium]
MKRLDRKSDCAINYSLEVLGDTWSLLIIRDMVNFGKKTYGEFLASNERIGTSVLARKLAHLERQGIISRQTSTEDRRKEEYYLTEKGILLVPLLNELAIWGATYDQASGADKRVIDEYRADRQGVIDRTQQVLRRGGAVLDNFNYIFQEKSIATKELVLA